MSRGRVLVTDGETRAMVAVARGLLDAGFEVSVAATARAPLAAAQLARSVSERLVTPNPLHAPGAFVTVLERALSGGNISVLIPGGDASLLTISDARARLEPHAHLGLPSPEAVRRSLDKTDLLTT